MNNFRLLSIFICILSVTIVSCDTVDFGDTNVDDDAPTEVNTEGLLAGGMNYFFTDAGRSYFNNPTLYVQYQSQNTYTTEMTYGENPYPWSAYYARVLNPFKTIVETTTADEVSATIQSFGHPDNQAAVAEIMSAVVFKRVTDTWGPIPYSNGDGSVGEGLAGLDNTTPAYSSQDVVYKNLIDRVKAARDMIKPAEAGPSGDVLYGGDMAKWQKFANSLLLSLSIQLSDADAAYAETEFNAALGHSAGVIETIADEAWYDHVNAPGSTNPLSANRAADYFLSDSFTDALNGTTNGDSTIVYSNTMLDERLNVFADQPGTDGAQYGVDKSTDTGASIGGDIWTPAGDLPYMTAAYTYLNRAEAANLGWTGEVAADMLEEGILMSYATVDAHWDDGDSSTGDLQTDGQAYATQRLADAAPTGNADDGIAQVIGEEKWVALFPMGFDAWSEWRRTTDNTSWTNHRGAPHFDPTGYPGLYPAVDATNGGTIPTRYIYPSSEEGANSSGYSGGVSSLTPAQDNNSSNFWWDVD